MHFATVFFFDHNDRKRESCRQLAIDLLSELFEKLDQKAIPEQLCTVCQDLTDSHPPYRVFVATDGNEKETETFGKIIRHTLFADRVFLTTEDERRHVDNISCSFVNIQLVRFVNYLLGGPAMCSFDFDAVFGNVPEVNGKWIKTAWDEEKSGRHMMWEMM